jgi:hypothetical protein
METTRHHALHYTSRKSLLERKPNAKDPLRKGAVLQRIGRIPHFGKGGQGQYCSAYKLFAKLDRATIHSKTSKRQLMQLLFYRKTPTSNTLKILIFAIGQSNSYSE